MPPLAAADFDALLLDLNGTFMFGHDRLGPDEDYHATYRALGGERLTSEEVRRFVLACIEDLSPKYKDPAWQDRFPSVAETLRALFDDATLPDPERNLIEAVIVQHELGEVPPAYAEALHRLADGHRLGLVSNLWSTKAPWLAELEAKGLAHLFEALVFSSDGPHIKPSPALFHQALTALAVAPERTLFIGDDPCYDIAGAQALGMKTLLVGDRRQDGIAPDWRLPSLIDLPDSLR